jgi:hypothetical protein
LEKLEDEVAKIPSVHRFKYPANKQSRREGSFKSLHRRNENTATTATTATSHFAIDKRKEPYV